MYGKINEDGRLFKKYRIQYNEINTTLRLKPQRAVEMCQDTAVCHSDEAGYTLDFFTENHCGWVLTGWHIIFGKLPKEGEDMDLATWTRPYKRLQADRSFRATDMDGNEIFRAMSRWFLFDTEKRRPKRFHSDFFDAYIPSELEIAIPEEDYTQPPLELYELSDTREFRVTRRDIDSNFHTNNIAYLDWAFDDVDDELFDSYTISELRAEYIKEAVKGDLVKSRYYKRTIDTKSIEVTSVFSDAEDDSKVLCRVTTLWHK